MKTWTTIDKSDWAPGEWHQEPDKAQWIDQATGLDCLIVRGPFGALCGYVGVPQSSPYFEKDYMALGEIDVHGGLTFGNRCTPNANVATGICHTGDVANKIVWWLGFDCSHADDISPLPVTNRFFAIDGYCYRNFDYVKSEVEALAQPLHN